MTSGNSSNSFGTIRRLALKMCRLYLDNVKLTLAEKLTVTFSTAIVLITLLVLGIFALAFLSGAIVQLLVLVLPQWAGYAVCCGFYLLLMVIIVVFRKPLIIDPTARFVSKLIFEHGQNDQKV